MTDARWFNKVHRAANDQDYESWAEGGVVPTLNVADVGDSRAVTVVTSFHLTQDPIVGEDITPLISSGSKQGTAVVGVLGEERPRQARTVRRLTPRECERLQGFPDDHTAQRVELKAGKRQGTTLEQADSPRYKQMGNAVAVPVVQWLLERVVAVDAMEDDVQTIYRATAHGDMAEGVGPLTARYGKDGKEGLVVTVEPTCANCGNDVGVHELCSDCLALIDPDAVPVPRALAHEVTAHLAQLGAAGDIGSLLLWHRLTQEVPA